MTKNSMSFDKVVGKILNVEQLQKVSGGQFKNISLMYGNNVSRKTLTNFFKSLIKKIN
ncbi:hypothetical protein [Lactiplantibacillus plantarum]|jgi:hypothetical protein|uniref:hypothetical protein n=1 Tax=Lactiplantibacillus plantarum TaxID=1590 RepID=UPI0007BB51FD|nr:hypothetical protein [Lactiplantibacillus plantarum]ARW34371.1 hypothetical protein S102022_00353 [Lactiplantibacillus plantarum]KZU80477.1 hypothetical protein Nizo3892_2625 [Lactiplantibacillus plantarum]KZU91240.1 hypothetical protein A1D15_2655 [Lactiplantibacillus plantarum]MBY8837596.1 hypothetical protein [Lactiplantibacillus plantarum]MCD7705950.1 hypothetical protein [Lactiplantibacillus plantarum]